MQKTMNQELNVVVMPTGYLQLAWTDAQNDISKSPLIKLIVRAFQTVSAKPGFPVFLYCGTIDKTLYVLLTK
jgi:hypothetical protein